MISKNKLEEHYLKTFKPIIKNAEKIFKPLYKTLGLAIYPDKVGEKETIEYLKLAKKNGFKKIFASLLWYEPDDKGKEIIEIFRRVGNFAKSIKLEVFYDVDKKFYKDWSIPETEVDFFVNLGASGIRYDGGFGGKPEAKVSHKIPIGKNLSEGTLEAEKTLEFGGIAKNITLSHNFYPQRYSGLEMSTFIQWCSTAKSKGFKTEAWIALDKKNRGYGPWDINEGLCTIESHRDSSIETQLEEMLSFGVVDNILIGEQPSLKKAENIFSRMHGVMEKYNNFFKHEFLEIPVIAFNNISKLEKKIMFDNISQKDRSDSNGYFLRGSRGRIIYKNSSLPENNAGKIIKPGDITVINEKMGKYKGEMHTAFKEIDDSQLKRNNLVGKLKNIDDLFYLKLTNLYPKIVKFVESKEYEG